MKETLLEKLLKAFGPSSKEDKVKELIKEELKNCDCELKEDKFGNLVAHIPHEGPKLMIASHLDTIGVIITDIDKNGNLRFAPIGGVRFPFLLSAHILFENGVVGVVQYEDKETPLEPKDFKVEKYFIDIGAKSKNASLEMVPIGSLGVFFPNVHISKDRVISPSLDDRVGCAILVEVLNNVKKKNLKYDLYGVFTVQEEVGVKGARTSTYEITPDLGIAIDVTLALDYLEPKKNALELGKGPAVKVMDGFMITNIELREELVNTAKSNQIPYQLEVITSGTTDAFAMQITKEGVKTAAISIPTRYIHTQSEMIDLNDVRNAVSLLKNFIEK